MSIVVRMEMQSLRNQRDSNVSFAVLFVAILFIICRTTYHNNK